MRDIVNRTVNYIESKYNIKHERPWKSAPENMTFKAKENGKWFALIMPVSGYKLGVETKDDIFVMNVKSDFELISILSQTAGYVPGYHMNKRNWLTVFLDGTVPMEQILDRIDESYNLITDSPTKRIYEAVKMIPYGKVATYGQVAKMAGNEKMSRAVGNALHKNPDPDNIPCYRVVNSKGELAGAFAFGGGNAQAKLLLEEGIEVIDGKVDLKQYGIEE